MSKKDQVSKLIDKSKLFNDQLKDQLQSYIIKQYEKRGLNFLPSSPYGQIIDVVDELNKLQFFYLEDALNERNLLTAYKENSIFGLARLTGHNPSRPISAKGEISLKIKPGITNEISGNNIQILNYTTLVCKNNQKTYTIKLDTDVVYIPKNSSNTFNFSIIEGTFVSSYFNGNGQQLQSYNIPSRYAQIENDNIAVFVNGQEFKLFESIYDMKKNEKGAIVKTGINGGIDIYFGNRDYGVIPDIGERIEVRWLSTTGLAGNLGEVSSSLVFEFIDSTLAGGDSEIDYNDIFDISVSKKVTMGADAEDKELTRFLLNKNSRSLVLANPTNYKYFLSKYNQFSYIEAFNTYGDEYLDDDNVVYLFLLPDITKKVESNSDYFTTNIENFYLSEDDKDAVYDVINKSGQQMISTELSIIDPIITKYALNIFIRVFDDIISEDSIKAEIVDKVGNYFININRRDKIPRSDIFKIIEEIDGVDSVYVEFISERNEQAMFNGYYIEKTTYNDTNFTNSLLGNLKNNSELSNVNNKTSLPVENKITLKEGENPNLGLDDFGDIIIGNKELPIIRGGFYDRNGVFYSDTLNTENLGSLNIVIREYAKRK